MKGVTILNEKKVRKAELWQFIADVLFCVWCVDGAIGWFSRGGICMDAGAICCFGALCGCGLLALHMFDKVTQYEVLIDKKVLYDDFIDDYQIVDKRGDIYVIEKVEENS